MQPNFATQDFWIGEQFATYLSYGETDGLSDAEVDEIDSFIASVEVGSKVDHWSITDGTDEFRRCEATDQYGSCVRVTAVYRLPQATA